MKRLYAILISALTLALAWRKWADGISRLSRGNDRAADPPTGRGTTLALAPHHSLDLVPQEPHWMARLRDTVAGRTLVVIANREPYIHQRKNGEIQVMRPASGLVTALEPVLRKCGGLWIAHGSGSADPECSDTEGEIAVPPGNPSYTLRRVWLSEEEEYGYYYGFSNEGLWPLCHLAHTRPAFRLSDWSQYQAVNRKFCEAVPERALAPGSVFLIQDYHYALLPKLLRARGPAAQISLFWHIPWPNAEAFGICPWGKELLEGMLGADVIGFHTQYHCNNFLDTCDRYLEARIDRESFSVIRGSHETRIRAYPIGIDTAPVRQLTDAEIAQLKEKLGIRARFVAVGVDRLDYTKGLLERIEAVERFLEKYPEFIGHFTLAQMGSPSRSNIPAYRELAAKLVQAVERVNSRFSAGAATEVSPIHFIPQHHDWEDAQRFYQIGDVCLVTSLHDGMNLVAKEYVWCQRAKRGSLILSRFAGASRELSDALIVNPYSTEEIADALAHAIRMPAEERERRMLAMKARVEGRNAFHWATELICALVPPGESARPSRPQPSLWASTG